MRIISLIPSATEIICALGEEENLVGRSHECDYPKSIQNLPMCTKLKFDVSGSSLDIEKSVNSFLIDSSSIYHIKEDLIKKIRPDIIFTQSQCNICAVSLEEVQAIFKGRKGIKPEIITLKPQTMEDIWKDINMVAESLGIPKKGLRLNRTIKKEIDLLESAKEDKKQKPTIACVEWIEPLMFAGNWVPEMVEIAGGNDIFGSTGVHSSWNTFENLLRSDPDKIIIMPCGYSIEKTKKEMIALKNTSNWTNLKAYKNNNIFIVDGNQYFNRPGPRILDSIKILKEIISNEKHLFGYKNKAWEKLHY